MQPAWTRNSPAGRNLHASPLPAQHPQGLSKEPQYFLSRGKGTTETFHPLVFSASFALLPASPSAPWPCPHLPHRALPRNTSAQVCEIQNPLLMIMVSTGLVVQQRQAGTFQSNFTVSYTGAGLTRTEHSDLGEAFGVKQLAHDSGSGIILSPLGRGNSSLILRLLFLILSCSLSDRALGLDTCPFCHILTFCQKAGCWPPQDDHGALRHLSSPLPGQSKAYAAPGPLTPPPVGSLRTGPCPCLFDSDFHLSMRI